MMETYRNNPDVSLVTSIKYKINEENYIIGEWSTISRNTVKISGETMGRDIFFVGNIIGYPTAVLY